jgi:glutamyl-tRNA synthetase
MKDRIRIFALQNALEHGGKASMGSVMGRAMSTFPELKADPRSTSALVKGIVDSVNSMGPADRSSELERLGGPEERTIRERNTDLPELPGDTVTGVRMRFAPGPSGPLHLGHSRAAILNDEYVKRYGGVFILRFEDTNPEKIELDAYRMIPEDLKWLGVTIHETYTQSDRFEIYYDISRRMLEAGVAYICTCDPDGWRENKARSIGCAHRNEAHEVQLERWDGMMDGTYGEEKASLVVKTDLNHPNPAVRDFVAMRIKDEPHPTKGSRYRVYPLYNFSVAIDDHLMGCTHVLRGKDHLNNTLRQEYVFKHMGWPLPYFHHYGLVSIPDTNLKKSLIKEDLKAGRVRGWDDVRLGTLRAMEARGIDPAALRRYWLEVGIKPVDITFSWDNLASYNRPLIDPSSNRYFFVADPIEISIRTVGVLEGKAPLHPDHLERGYRVFRLAPVDGVVRVLLSKDDVDGLSPGDLLRLKDLCNVHVTSIDPLEGEYSGQNISDVRSGKGKIIQWVPGEGIPCVLRYPDAHDRSGVAEPAVGQIAPERRLVQFERIGFFKLFFTDMVEANFLHR